MVKQCLGKNATPYDKLPARFCPLSVRKPQAYLLKRQKLRDPLSRMRNGLPATRFLLTTCDKITGSRKTEQLDSFWTLVRIFLALRSHPF